MPLPLLASRMAAPTALLMSRLVYFSLPSSCLDLTANVDPSFSSVLESSAALEQMLSRSGAVTDAMERDATPKTLFRERTAPGTSSVST